MGNKLDNFLSSCSEMEFGAVNLSDLEKDFYRKFNSEIVSLCDSLPESVQTDALLFFMKHSGLSIGQELDFFKNFYVPSWSVIYWLIQYLPNSKELFQGEIKNAVTAHSMAMNLHSLDDHINDGEIPASHLTLLLRSQLWMTMINSLKNLSVGLDKGEGIVRNFIDDYYSGILGSNDINTLEHYCDLFKKQMATWLIVPVLMTKMINNDEEFTGAVQAAYESFGIAWRLLDDINDIQIDMKNGAHSSIYVCLPEKIKKLWDKNEKTESNNKNTYPDIILDYILDISLIARIKKKIIKELQSAASISENFNLDGLAGEFRCLLEPHRDWQNFI